MGWCLCSNWGQNQDCIYSRSSQWYKEWEGINGGILIIVTGWWDDDDLKCLPVLPRLLKQACLFVIRKIQRRYYSCTRTIYYVLCGVHLLWLDILHTLRSPEVEQRKPRLFVQNRASLSRFSSFLPLSDIRILGNVLFYVFHHWESAAQITTAP